jgi:hypothetical protein
MLHTLPVELFLDILERCDRHAWRRLSLVFKRLRNPAQKLLFATLDFQLWTPYLGAPSATSERVNGILASPRFLSFV